jgi:hypothetical protein
LPAVCWPLLPKTKDPPLRNVMWLGGQLTRGACLPTCRSGLEEVEAVEPNPCRCAPAVKPCWTVSERAERTFIGPLLRPQETRHRAILRHGTQKLGLLPVPEQIVRAIVQLQPGWRPLKSRMHGGPKGCFMLIRLQRLRELYRSPSRRGSPPNEVISSSGPAPARVGSDPRRFCPLFAVRTLIPGRVIGSMQVQVAEGAAVCRNLSNETGPPGSDAAGSTLHGRNPLLIVRAIRDSAAQPEAGHQPAMRGRDRWLTSCDAFSAV